MARRFTGFPPEVIDLMSARSGGRCEVQANGCTGAGEQWHHRRPRGMGGTRRASTNRASAGLHVCQACHLYLESHRAEAVMNGWLVRQSAEPATQPVFYRRTDRLLTDDGRAVDFAGGVSR